MMSKSCFSLLVGVVYVAISCGGLRVEAQCANGTISGASVDTTNGPWTCHIDDASDKVHMTANAWDFDLSDNSPPSCCNCPSGDRIDLPSTSWSITSGVLDSATGTTNRWKAGTSIGHKTLTVIFMDLNDGPRCDDPNVQITQTLTAFKVGVHLATSGGSSLTRWEDSAGGGNVGLGGTLSLDHILTGNPNPARAGASTVATWTLRNNPAGTAMKQNIRAWAHASGGNLGGPNQGRIYGVTADSDWDVGANGSASMSFSFSYGLVGISYIHRLGDDDNLSTLSAGAGFASELHNDFEEKISLVSLTTTGPNDTEIFSHSPADARLTGDHGESKQAEWEIGYRLERKMSGSNWAAAEVDIDLSYLWTVTNTPPSYGP